MRERPYAEVKHGGALVAPCLAMVGFLAVAGGCAARPPSGSVSIGKPESAKALVQAAVDAIKDGDWEAYGRLVAAVEETRASCPSLARDAIRARRAAALEQARAGITACRRLVTWLDVAPLTISGGTLAGRVAKCRDIQRLSNLEVDLRARGQRFHLTLADPYLRADRFFGLTGTPTCALAPAR